MPLKISCDLGTQPVLHKYCHSGFPVLALLDISKLSTMSGFWCAFILKSSSLAIFSPLGIFFFLMVDGGIDAYCCLCPHVSGICIILVMEKCSLAKVSND